MWFSGIETCCDGCLKMSEVVFTVLTPTGSKHRICPECCRQQAEAAILEAEAIGMNIPLSAPEIANDVIEPTDVVAQAKAELLDKLLQAADKRLLPLRAMLNDPLVQLELEIGQVG